MRTVSEQTVQPTRFPRRHREENDSILVRLVYRVENSSSILNGDFLWFQLFVEVLLRMIDDQKAKQEFVGRCRARYASDTVEQRKIDEFASNYRQSDAIRWYTRDSFVYRMINEALRTQDLETLYALRILIIDIHQQLQCLRGEQHSLLKSQHFYRSQSMAIEEVNRFKDNLGNFISMNSFLSTSADKDMALSFSGERPGFCRVLFDLQVGLCITNTKPFANITVVSYYPDEEEVLFMLGAIFRICMVEFNPEVNYWTIVLELRSDNDNILKPSFDSLKDDIDETTNLYELGRVLWNMKHTDAAERCFKELLQQEHSNIHIVPGCYLNLGNIAIDRGLYDQAISYHRQALELKQQLLPANHPHLPYSHNSLGEAFREHGDFNQALFHYHEALKLWRNQYGNDDHENVALCLHNIGIIYGEQDEPMKALQYLFEALKIMEQCLPDIHPRIARTLKNIGAALGMIGNFDESFKMFTKALAIQRKCLPSTHVQLVETLRDIGIYYENIGDSNQALDYYEQAAGILAKTVTLNHPLYLKIQRDIDDIHQALSST